MDDLNLLLIKKHGISAAITPYAAFSFGMTCERKGDSAKALQFYEEAMRRGGGDEELTRVIKERMRSILAAAPPR